MRKAGPDVRLGRGRGAKEVTRDIEILQKQIQNGKGAKLKHGGKEKRSMSPENEPGEPGSTWGGGGGCDLEVTMELFSHLTSPVFAGGLHALVVG